MIVLPADRSTNLLIWVALVSLLAIWQVVTVRRRDLPSIAAMVWVLRRWFLTRWLLLFGWVWLGWHLFVRTTP